MNCANLSTRYAKFLAIVSVDHEPVTFSEAARHRDWRDAMIKEIKALESNNTWPITSLPPGKKVLEYKWVYKIKYKSDGSIEHPKV